MLEFVNVSLTLNNRECVSDYKLLFSFGNKTKHLYLFYIYNDFNINFDKTLYAAKKCFYNSMHEKHDYQEDYTWLLLSVS